MLKKQMKNNLTDHLNEFDNAEKFLEYYVKSNQGELASEMDLVALQAWKIIKKRLGICFINLHSVPTKVEDKTDERQKP